MMQEPIAASTSSDNFRIVADYRYVAEDYQEALAARTQALTGQKTQKPKPKWTNSGMLGWGLFVTLMVAFVYAMKFNRPATTFTRGPVSSVGEPPLTHNWLQMLCISVAAPALLMALILFLTSKAQNQRRVPFYKPRMPRPVLSRIFLQVVAAMMGLVGIAALVAIFKLPIEPDWRPDVGSLIGVLFGPWFVFILLVSMLISTASKRGKQRQKSGLFDVEGSSSFEPQHLEADDSRIAVSTPIVQHVFTWPYFVSYLESENLLMIFTRDLTVQIVPKRAFMQPGSFERFCGLVQNHVQAGRFLPRASAFAVLPVIPSAQSGH
jgi:hypothetical protein